jgi:carbamoyltransferase
VAAAQEERFTRKLTELSDTGCQCLREAKISPEDLDYVVFYEKPLRKLSGLETYLAWRRQDSKFHHGDAGG